MQSNCVKLFLCYIYSTCKKHKLTSCLDLGSSPEDTGKYFKIFKKKLLKF